MINVHAVTDQKIAVGAVENPACERLREFAALVPADQVIVEVGAFKGRTAGWLALGASEGHGAHVYSVDPWEQRSADDWPDGYASRSITDQYGTSEAREFYLHHLEECGITDRVTPIQGFAVDVGKAWDGPKIGLLYHDAEHTKQAVAADLRAWIPHLADPAVVVLHDVGDPRFEVEVGAQLAISRRKGWDWNGREIQLWPKQPNRRGILIVHKR